MSESKYEPKYESEEQYNMDYRHTDAYQMAYDLSVYLHKKVQTFPKYEKFTLQKDIRESIDNVMDEIEMYEKTSNASHIYAADRHKSRLVRKIRLSYDLRYLDKKAYKYISKEVGVMGAYIGSLVNKARNERKLKKG